MDQNAIIRETEEQARFLGARAAQFAGVVATLEAQVKAKDEALAQANARIVELEAARGPAMQQGLNNMVGQQQGGFGQNYLSNVNNQAALRPAVIHQDDAEPDAA